MNLKRETVRKSLLNRRFFMVDQMQPHEKMAQFKVRRGWFWRLVRFLNSRPLIEQPIEP